MKRFLIFTSVLLPLSALSSWAQTTEPLVLEVRSEIFGLPRHL